MYRSVWPARFREPVRKPCGLRDAVPGRARQGEFHRFRKRDAVAHAHEYRPYPVAGSENRADLLILIHQRRNGPFRGQRLLITTNQAGFGNPEGGLPEQHTEMGSNSEPARMRPAVAVRDEQIRLGAQFFEGRKNRRYLAKTEQAGHVRKNNVALHDGLFYDGEVGVGYDNYSRTNAFVADRNIDTGYGARGCRKRLLPNQTGKPALHANRFRRRQIPGMCMIRMPRHISDLTFCLIGLSLNP